MVADARKGRHLDDLTDEAGVPADAGTGGTRIHGIDRHRKHRRRLVSAEVRRNRHRRTGERDRRRRIPWVGDRPRSQHGPTGEMIADFRDGSYLDDLPDEAGMTANARNGGTRPRGIDGHRKRRRRLILAEVRRDCRRRTSERNGRRRIARVANRACPRNGPSGEMIPGSRGGGDLNHLAHKRRTLTRTWSGRAGAGRVDAHR